VAPIAAERGDIGKHRASGDRHKALRFVSGPIALTEGSRGQLPYGVKGAA
jgi:hypothetical protein